MSTMSFIKKCSCKKTYVGETKRNATTKWAEHKATNGTSEPAKHISTNPSHEFEWKVLSRAADDWRKRIFEAFFIKMFDFWFRLNGRQMSLLFMIL